MGCLVNELTFVMHLPLKAKRPRKHGISFRMTRHYSATNLFWTLRRYADIPPPGWTPRNLMNMSGPLIFMGFIIHFLVLVYGVRASRVPATSLSLHQINRMQSLWWVNMMADGCNMIPASCDIQNNLVPTVWCEPSRFLHRRLWQLLLAEWATLSRSSPRTMTFSFRWSNTCA